MVWVGFDDYTELGLEGARSALPIWTEFMMEAARYKQFGDAKPFAPPPGVVKADVDCSGTESSYFIGGTQPAAAQCAPQDVEVTPAADGGVTESSTPASAAPQHPQVQAAPSTPEQSISVEVPVTPSEPTSASPPR